MRACVLIYIIYIFFRVCSKRSLRKTNVESITLTLSYSRMLYIEYIQQYVLSSLESLFYSSMSFFPISMGSTIPLNPLSLTYCFHCRTSVHINSYYFPFIGFHIKPVYCKDSKGKKYNFTRHTHNHSGQKNKGRKAICSTNTPGARLFKQADQEKWLLL